MITAAHLVALEGVSRPDQHSVPSSPRGATRCVSARAGDRRCVLDATVRTRGAQLEVTGELDLAESSRLQRVLLRLDELACPLTVDLRGVTFADTHGVQPLVDDARRRVAAARSPLLLVGASPAVRRVFDLLGVPWGPRLDVVRWDALTTPR